MKKQLREGPKYHIARKYYVKQGQPIPGPSDYNFNPISFLKQEPRSTINRAPKDRDKSREKSPGVGTYNTGTLAFKKRTKSVIFNREKRKGFGERETSPGPGAYMIPCRFYDRPKFMLKKENKFRFV